MKGPRLFESVRDFKLLAYFGRRVATIHTDTNRVCGRFRLEYHGGSCQAPSRREK